MLFFFVFLNIPTRYILLEFNFTEAPTLLTNGNMKPVTKRKGRYKEGSRCQLLIRSALTTLAALSVVMQTMLVMMTHV